MTDLLRQKLLQVGNNPDNFIKQFADWKALGPAGEDNVYVFGKDSEYARPTVNNKRVLRHVHLVPIQDAVALQKWNFGWNNYKRRVSDIALVYVDGGMYGFLLITILAEPDAHDISKMATPEHRELMINFADTAEQFIFKGTYDS